MSVPVQSSLPYSPDARIDFGWIGQAWTLFKAQSGVWIGAVFLCFLLSVAVSALLLFATGGWTAFHSIYASIFQHPRAATSYSPAPSPLAYQHLAVTQAKRILTAGINAVFLGGLYRMALRQKRGELITVSGLFSALPQSVPLFLVGIAAPVVLALLWGASLWPLHHFAPFASTSLIVNVSLFFHSLLDGVLMFAPVLVLDANASVPEALLGSVRLMRGQIVRGVGFYLWASFIGVIGILGCGVGMLATYPVFVLSIAIGYVALTGTMPEAVPFDPAPAGVWPPPPRTE